MISIQAFLLIFMGNISKMIGKINLKKLLYLEMLNSRCQIILKVIRNLKIIYFSQSLVVQSINQFKKTTRYQDSMMQSKTINNFSHHIKTQAKLISKLVCKRKEVSQQILFKYLEKNQKFSKNLTHKMDQVDLPLGKLLKKYYPKS